MSNTIPDEVEETERNQTNSRSRSRRRRRRKNQKTPPGPPLYSLIPPHEEDRKPWPILSADDVKPRPHIAEEEDIYYRPHWIPCWVTNKYGPVPMYFYVGDHFIDYSHLVPNPRPPPPPPPPRCLDEESSWAEWFSDEPCRVESIDNSYEGEGPGLMLLTDSEYRWLYGDNNGSDDDGDCLKTSEPRGGGQFSDTESDIVDLSDYPLKLLDHQEADPLVMELFHKYIFGVSIEKTATSFCCASIMQRQEATLMLAPFTPNSKSPSPPVVKCVVKIDGCYRKGEPGGCGAILLDATTHKHKPIAAASWTSSSSSKSSVSVLYHQLEGIELGLQLALDHGCREVKVLTCCSRAVFTTTGQLMPLLMDLTIDVYAMIRRIRMKLCEFSSYRLDVHPRACNKAADFLAKLGVCRYFSHPDDFDIGLQDILEEDRKREGDLEDMVKFRQKLVDMDPTRIDEMEKMVNDRINAGLLV